MKAEADKLDIDKLTNFSTSLKNLKTKIDDLDAGKLKTLPVDLKKLTYVVEKQAVKNTKFNILNTKINNLEKKNPHATTLIYINQYNTLIYINQYNTDKQNFEKKIGDVDKNIRRW